MARPSPWVQWSEIVTEKLWLLPFNDSSCSVFHILILIPLPLLSVRSQLYPSSRVLEVHNAICGWILRQEWAPLSASLQIYTSHIMTFLAVARYCRDDCASVSCAKNFQAFLPIFLQSCETKSGTKSLGSRLVQHKATKSTLEFTTFTTVWRINAYTHALFVRRTE